MMGDVVGSGSDTGILTATFSSGISFCTASSISGMALGLAACVVKTLAVSTNRTDTQIPTHAGILLKLKIARIRSSALLFAKPLHSGADFGFRCAMSSSVSA